MTAYRNSNSEVAHNFPSTYRGTLIEDLIDQVDLVAQSNSFSDLATHVEFTRFCAKCDSEQLFVAAWECSAGLVGCCRGCGDERIAPFTRSTTEAA